MIDRTALLATLKPAVTRLEASIQARIADTPEIAEHLKLEHHRAEVAERTAMSLEEWQDGEVTQAAVAWVLAGVFVRFLEDNRLIDQPLITGPGQRGEAALGHRSNYFQQHPGHSDREYLEACFREIAAFPAVAPLYDERHNPLWRLGPTADGAKVVRETFTAIDPATGDLVQDFTDPDLDTRFLGDLYQDLSEAAKKRYALLQTPDFVESFILDRTLTPAIDEFGLAEVRLIDPTCGSGHFLIDAFHRISALWQEREPGTTATVLAQRALDQIAGVDLNPYATAIARFRLIVVALKACSIPRLAEAPAFALNLATGDSLLHGPLPFEGASTLFDAGRLDKNIAHVYESEDADELKRILGRGYHAVVGNPPYITGEDPGPREAYRSRYASCRGEFPLSVPFMERFFELAQLRSATRPLSAGFVGKITANSFMRREFGGPLVTQFLPSVEVTHLVDTSLARIPGHTTPTVIVFGRARQPESATVRLVEALRGERARFVELAASPTWADLVVGCDYGDYETLYARASDVPRTTLWEHPMVIGSGRLVRARLLKRTSTVVSDLAVTLGYSGQTNLDDVFLRPPSAWDAAKVPTNLRATFVTGTDLRDWVISAVVESWYPYEPSGLLDADQIGETMRVLWPWRESAWARRTFNKKSYKEEGRAFYEWHQIALSRHQTPIAVAWAYKTSGNHFAVSRGSQVFNRHAPFIKLKDESLAGALALAAVLNSSTIAFLLKQVCQDTGGDGVGEAWEPRYEFGVAPVGSLPLPRCRPDDLATALDSVGQAQSAVLEGLHEMPESSIDDILHDRAIRSTHLLHSGITLQEELDWRVLAAYGLVTDDLPVMGESAPPIKLGERAFEIALARQVAAGETETTWFARHGSAPITEVPTVWPQDYREIVERRIELIASDPDVGLIERPEHKRRWSRAPWEERVSEALTKLVLVALEAPEVWEDLRPRSTAELTDYLRGTPLLVEALEVLAGDHDADLGETVERLVSETAVPHLAAQRLKESGLRKRAVWEQVWDLQRAEDRGEDPGRIPVPPRYAQGDFTSAISWKYRGKLDVPKERFVLIPGAQRGADTSSVVGWAGWDELALARALAGRSTELRNEEAADAERVTSLLAGVLELLPWIHQWHPESDSAFGGPPGTFLESWLDGQLSELAVTRETLRAWRPPAPTRGRRRATA